MTAGFGIVELLVSISIMALVSGVILVQQNSFNGSVLLRNQVYQVALTVREVQMGAVSAVGVGGQFRSLLGLHFSTSNPSGYNIFRDADGDMYFDSTEAFGKQGGIDDRFEIRAIRSVTGTAETSVSNVSIVFERPNFDARFYGSAGEFSTATAIEIDIAKRGSSGGGADSVRTLEVTSTGQITVQES